MTIPRLIDTDERVLLEAARGGDQRAFGVLLERHAPALEVFCGLMLGDAQHARHAVQDAALTAWRERGLAAASPSVRMWLYGIVLRVCLEALGDEFPQQRAFDGGNGDDESDRR